MNEDVEQMLRQVGSDEVWDARPQPDPLGRLSARVQRRRAGRRLATGAAVAGVVTVAAVGAAVAIPKGGSDTHRGQLAGGRPSIGACSFGNLKLAQLRDVTLSARWAQATYRLTNTGSAACTLDGYPTVSARGPSARGIALTVHRTTQWASGNVKASEVTLKPGASAAFYFAVKSADCDNSLPATLYLRLPAAPQSAHGFARPGATFCAGQNVYVSPVMPASATTSR